MSYTARNSPTLLPNANPPALEGSEREFMLQQMQRIRMVVNDCVRAIDDIQTYLENTN